MYAVEIKAQIKSDGQKTVIKLNNDREIIIYDYAIQLYHENKMFREIKFKEKSGSDEFANMFSPIMNQ